MTSVVECSAGGSTLREGQYVGMIVTALITAMASIVASSLIATLAYPKRHTSLYQRILLALSIVDILSSTSMALHPFLLPKGDPGSYWAIGTVWTCEIGAFLVFLPTLGAIFNSYLSLYFLATIRWNLKDQRRMPKWEWGAYFGAFLVALIPHIVGFATGSYNPTGLTHLCYFAEYPRNCHTDTTDENECIRGDNANLLLIPSMVVFSLSSIIGIGATLWLYWTVRTTLKKSENHNNFSSSLPGSSQEGIHHRQEHSSNTNNLDSDSTKRLKNVRTQAVCYTLVYLNTFMWNSINAVIENTVTDSCRDGDPEVFVWTLMAWIMFPLQGALNFLVYIRPTYQRWRKHSNFSRLQCLRRSCSQQIPPTRKIAKESTTGSSH